jgi:hypothetical protein
MGPTFQERDPAISKMGPGFQEWDPQMGPANQQLGPAMDYGNHLDPALCPAIDVLPLAIIHALRDEAIPRQKRSDGRLPFIQKEMILDPL